MSADRIPPQATTGPGEARRSQRRRARRAASGVVRQRFFAVLVLFAAVFIYFSLTSSRFFTTRDLDSLVTSAAVLWMVSLGLTFVMLTGGFDLSLGSLLALSGIALGKLVSGGGLGLGFGIVLTLAFGLGIGAVGNGVLIGRLKLPFLVVTLGTLTLFGGVVDLWSKSVTTELTSPALTALAFNHVAGVPIPGWVMLGAFAIVLYVQRATYLGRDIYAVGGSAEAARLSGVRVGRTLIVVYAIAGGLAAAGGVIQDAQIGAASPLVGSTVIFTAAAAVLLGGTSFAGGVGGVGGTAVGVAFLATLQQGLEVSGVQDYWQQIITGLILIAVVLLDLLQHRGLSGIGPLRWRRTNSRQVAKT